MMNIQGNSQFMHDVYVLCSSHGVLQKMLRHFGKIDLFRGGEKYAGYVPGPFSSVFFTTNKTADFAKVPEHFT